VERIVRSRNYVFYPAEGEKPPRTKDELRAAMERRGLNLKSAGAKEEPVAAVKAAEGAARSIGARGGVKSE
jgi:hypothetical protein